jgi:Phosphate-selective porin O and P
VRVRAFRKGPRAHAHVRSGRGSRFILQSFLSFRRLTAAVVFAVVWPGIAAAQGDSEPPHPSDPAPPASPSTSPPAAPERPALTSPASSSADAPLRGEVDALRDEVRALRLQVESARAPQPVVQAKPPPVPGPPPHPLGYESFWPWVLPSEGLTLGGYLQSQYESHQDSQDQLAQGGALLNKNRFLIRRARVSLLGEWEYAAIALEIDANTQNGPQVDLRKAEASLQYRPNRSRPPIIMATLGQFDTPFGYELVESPRTRWFMERSTASQAFWPGEPDLGVRLAGALGFFRWTIAALNGEPLGEKSAFALQDPNNAKDILFRFGFDTSPRDDLQIAGGISTLRGRGFSPGTDATKSGLQWTDLNDDGSVESNELSPVPAGVAAPSQNYDRWAAGADLRVSLRSPIGVTKVYGEVLLGSNMDRNQYFANPILTGIDQRELGYYVAALQDITPYAEIGFRYDTYDPNSNAFDKRGGRLLPFSQAIRTASPLVGLTLPDRARLVFQYDVVRNALARTAQGVPTDLKANVWTIRLQVQL